MMNMYCKGPVRAPVTCLDPSPIRALSRPGPKNELTVQLKKTRNVDTTGRKRCGVVVVARATKPSTGTAILGAPFGGGGGDIFVAGATGQIGARIVKELLQGGQKVIAAVQDADEGAALLDFAKRFELLKGVDAGKVRLAEVDFSDEEAIAAAIPKRGKVVVIVGDTGVKGKADAKLPSRIIDAAKERDAARLVLVAPGGSGGGGGFFGGGRGGGAGKPPPPSKLEEEVAESGLSFAIVRTGKYEDDSFGEEAELVLGAQGSLPAGARISKRQAAEVAALLLRTATDDVLVEAWATPEAEAEPVEQLLAEVLPRVVIGEDAPAEVEEEEEEEEAAPAAKAAAKPGFSLFPPRTPPAKAVEEEEEEEDEAPAPVKKPAFGFRFGGGKAAGRKETLDSEPEEEEEEEKPVKKGLFGGFGSKKKPVIEEEEEEEEEEEAKPSKSLFGGFGVRAAKAATVEPEEEKPAKKGLFGFGGKAAPKEEEKEPEKPAKKGLFGFGGKAPKEEDEQDEEPKKPLGGLFGGTRKIQKEEDAPATPRRTPPPMPSGQMLTIRGRASSPAGGAPARTPRRGPAPQPKAPPPPAAKSVRGTTSGPVVRGRNPIAAPAPPPKPSRAPAKGGDEKAPPKKGGFLQSLGIGQDTAFVDELD